MSDNRLVFDLILKTSKKQVLVLASFTPMIKASKKNKVILKKVFLHPFFALLLKKKYKNESFN